MPKLKATKGKPATITIGLPGMGPTLLVEGEPGRIKLFAKALHTVLFDPKQFDTTVYTLILKD